MPAPVEIDAHVPSKNFRARITPIRYIIIHCSAYPVKTQLETLENLGLSTHYLISAKGEITQSVTPDKVAYHAGKSAWLNDRTGSLNDLSIGIELEQKNLGQLATDYPRFQITQLSRLIKELIYKYKIRKENVLGHSDIAPTRKPDPGAGFPWKRLAKKDLALWYTKGRLSKETSEQKLLETIGYDTTDLIAARYAFCRHYIPQEVIVEESLTALLNRPCPENFTPKDREYYQNTLRAVANSYAQERRRRYWFLE